MNKLLIFLLLFCPTILAAGEYGSFEAIYKESNIILWIIVAFITVLTALVVFYSAGTVSSIIAPIGTWIGTTMGYSGIAATNAGLALLGGGSLVSGGAGMLGGTALLTAALTFSTEVSIDYVIGSAVSEYKYQQLQEYSKKMTTLPIPANSSGSDTYEYAIKLLKKIKKDSLINSPLNQNIILGAINTINGSNERLSLKEKVKLQSLLSILYFLSNNYDKAKLTAYKTMDYAKLAETKATVAEFIYAVSLLYDKKVLINQSLNYFSTSLKNESDNPLIHLLTSIYLDRLSLRLNDESISIHTYKFVYDDLKSLIQYKYDKKLLKFLNDFTNLKLIIYTGMYTRHLMILKSEQLKIRSLTKLHNRAIKVKPEILFVAQKSLSNYKLLLKYSHNILSSLLILDSDKLTSESKKEIKNFTGLYRAYAAEEKKLNKLVNNLEEYQRERRHYDKLFAQLMKNIQSLQDLKKGVISLIQSNDFIQAKKQLAEFNKLSNLSQDSVNQLYELMQKLDYYEKREIEDSSKLFNIIRKSYDELKKNIHNKEKLVKAQIKDIEKNDSTKMVLYIIFIITLFIFLKYKFKKPEKSI